jgi:hypothetical protein
MLQIWLTGDPGRPGIRSSVSPDPRVRNCTIFANGTTMNDKPKPAPQKPQPGMTPPPPPETARQALQQSMDRRW